MLFRVYVANIRQMLLECAMNGFMHRYLTILVLLICSVFVRVNPAAEAMESTGKNVKEPSVLSDKPASAGSLW